MPTYETTKEQRQQLLNAGYVLLSGALPDPLLIRWQELAARLEAEALNAHQQGHYLSGVAVIDTPDGPRLLRYNDIHGVDVDAVLDLLACPGMLAVARELCGRYSVPMQIDILYKQPSPSSVVLWHQGAPHPRGFPYLNVGIYLDDAPAGDGCLRYVPGTQHEKQDICDLAKTHGWQIPGVVEQPAMAGDILVQDMMVLHGSMPKQQPDVRRTIYVEFRPVGGIAESGVQSEQWAELRRRWMGLVLRRAEVPDWPEAWRADYPVDLESDEEEMASVLALPEPPIPAFYCHEKIETEDYPVPGDLRR